MSKNAPSIQTLSILNKETIHAGFHMIPYITQTVLTKLPSSTYVLFTDTNIEKAGYLQLFHEEFAKQIAGLAKDTPPRFLSRLLPPGEQSKSREGKASLEDFMLEHKCTRDTVVLALGGGVVGDLVGFVSATFMRGVKFVQIPTTLLAMVDSAVGGKTAIDTPHGKNLIGAFWQPEYIFIDAAFLETLPVREFSNGMAEVVKTAAIWDADEFISLESRPAEILSAIQTPSKDFAGRSLDTRSESQSLLLSVILGSIRVKAHIVSIDPLETGLRNLVNFGHSIGHAIEAVVTPEILHGECVSVGIILEAELSRQLGILGQVSVGRLTRVLKSFGLPVSLHEPLFAKHPRRAELTIDRLLDVMRIDKKNAGAEKKIVLLKTIGETHEPKATFVRDEFITTTLAESVEVIPGVPTKAPVKMTTPGSKSISNRALVLAALGKGECRLKNLLHSDDTAVMMNALKELKGAKFSWADGGETLVVKGGEGALSLPSKGKELYLGNAGTAARFLTTVCTLVQAADTPSEDDATIITGNARMKQRPIGPLVTALSANGSKIAYLEGANCLPLSIAPSSFRGGHIQLAASVSSQYVSSILLCAPYAKEQVVLDLVGGEVISQPYIDMTIAMMKTFGITATRRVGEDGKPLHIYDIPQGVYINPSDYSIESDASSATYPLAIAAITGTTCTIENIGSASLQGDARFAIEVLERMGCTVQQTAEETTVTGPKIGGLKSVEEIDMTVMTDAFLTASVLAAVTGAREGGDTKTRIIGIKNQRVKECNRIRAMIDQLAKFGVETIELDDGLEIFGRPIPTLLPNASVDCYDDHRVAMAFSVLSTIVPGTILEEKRCVEKTWPNWWDDLVNKIGIQVKGVELSSHSNAPVASSSTPSKSIPATPPTSVIIIGMRGSGKSFIGALSSRTLEYPFIDADFYFEARHSISVREYVHQHGWEKFREEETSILAQLIQEKGNGHIISLGGGIVETPAARQLLINYGAAKGVVVYIARPLSAITQYLATESARPAYGEPIAEVFQRRRPWFRECATHEFVNHGPGVETDLSHGTQGTVDEVERFFKHLTGLRPNLSHNVGVPGRRSYFLSLTYPDIMPYLGSIDQLSVGVDAIELRVDLLRAPDAPDALIPSKEYVWEQIASLRRHTSLPIVFTVRSAAQGGSFPDAAVSEAVDLLAQAFRLGLEYIDIELPLFDLPSLQTLIKTKGSSQIIASWHDWTGGLKWDGAEIEARYQEAAKVGDIVKIVSKATSLSDNLALRSFVEAKGTIPGAKPFIAINMGGPGQLSRILNPTLTPVSHPLLPVAAAPGQLSFVQIQQALHLIGQLPSRKFYLFGSPISHSLSPTIHNTAFQSLGLPYEYSLHESSSIGEDIEKIIRADDFGGASVTIPHKLSIIPLLDNFSEAATITGAVNTIIPTVDTDGKKILVGDNTDVSGILTSLTTSTGISSANVHGALLIGAGGTARAAIYALKLLKVPVVYIYNKTQSKAQALKEAFPDVNIVVLDTIDGWGDAQVNVIVSCVPAYNTTLTPVEGSLLLPPTLFAYSEGPAVVLDMAYKPAKTPLLSLAQNSKNWAKVTGIDALIAQGVSQNELWTGLRCPTGDVRRAVWTKFEASISA